MKTDAIVIPIVPEIAAKRILFATDFSEVSLSALPLVSTIARKYQSRVFVVNVWTPVPYTMIVPKLLGFCSARTSVKLKPDAQLFESQRTDRSIRDRIGHARSLCKN